MAQRESFLTETDVIGRDFSSVADYDDVYRRVWYLYAMN